MSLDEVISFLRETRPFKDLDEAAIRNLAAGVTVEFYPKDTAILKQDGPASDYLQIIKKGAVKVYVGVPDQEGVTIDYRTEGMSFGFLSLVGRDRSRANVTAVEDTTCYLLGREAVLKLLETHPSFSEYFFVSFLDKYINKAFREVRKRSLSYGNDESPLFATTVGDIITDKLITSTPTVTIREASELMSRERISSLILTDGDGVPVGIVTDRDLRDKVVSKGRNVSEPISSIMSLSLIKVEARDYCFEALLKMIQYNIHHLMVIENGALKGMITNHDLMMLQGASPISVVRDIETRQSIEELAPISKKINRIVGLLLKEGARATNITRVISELNDRLHRKILSIAERKFGLPPVDYCWIVFGSEGRKEQTFRTDQDNALIYADLDDPETERKASEYFAEFSRFVKEGLAACGFPPCPAGYMADNPEWRKPLRQWKKHFQNWITEPTSEAVLRSLIFFDFRPLHGNFALAEELRDYLLHTVRDQKVFLGSMANMIIKNTPPTGFFRTFVVETSGEHKDELNMKVKGIAPFIDMMRLFSLEKGVSETSTAERIAALRDRHAIVGEYADEILHAFEFIMLLRIQHQFEQIESGKEPDNFINPNKLSTISKRTIKEAFSLVSRIQSLIIERYKAMIW